MTPAWKRADQAFTKASKSTASEKRDIAFFGQRRAQEVANLKRTLELRALRLASEASKPKPKGVRRRPPTETFK